VTTSPLIEDVTLGFLKVVKNSFSWELQLDLSHAMHDQSPDNLSAKLDALIQSTAFFTMTHLGTWTTGSASPSGTARTSRA
jgi:hypothetical protein